jgi:uncharacterized membrane protein YqgA involved in biofilm formation
VNLLLLCKGLVVTGTIINIFAILVGGLIGVIAGNRFPAKIQETVMAGLGLMTGVIGMSMAITSANILIPLFSVLAGGILGEWLGIDEALNRFGRWLETRYGDRLGQGKVAGWSVTRGFVTASLVFCVGPMTILGSIQDGLLGDYQLLAIKSMLDGFAAIPFAASLGPGVLVSIVTVLVVQGGISGLALLLGASLPEVTSALGGGSDGHRRRADPRDRAAAPGSQTRARGEPAAGGDHCPFDRPPASGIQHFILRCSCHRFGSKSVG